MIRGLIGAMPVGLRLAINIIVAFLPAAVLGVRSTRKSRNIFSTPAGDRSARSRRRRDDSHSRWHRGRTQGGTMRWRT